MTRPLPPAATASSRRSAAEQAIRDAVIARLRVLLPEARIVHELNCGCCGGRDASRMDLAAVTPTRLVAVEIKSELDVTKRLEKQLRAFTAVSHRCILVAHEKHWRKCEWQRADLPPREPPEGVRRSEVECWRFPLVETCEYPDRWDLDLRQIEEPQASRFLDLLWREELREACGHLRLSSTTRTTRPEMISKIVWNCTGAEIAKAVCAALRRREFAEADPVMP